jgi:SAM-dependent methyltransferase
LSKKLNLINLPFEKITEKLSPADLVICSNVIDQCDKPLSLIDFLVPLVKPGGVLVLSCTYQWNEKYVGQINYPNYPIQDINDLFGPKWSRLGETNLEFRCRKNERFWSTFMSHVAIFQKK